MGVAPTVAMGPLADGSISNFVCNISIYLCTNFGAFIKKCTIRPKMAAYPLYYEQFSQESSYDIDIDLDHSDSSLNNIKIHAFDVYLILKEINAGKAAGPDKCR